MAGPVIDIFGYGGGGGAGAPGSGSDPSLDSPYGPQYPPVYPEREKVDQLRRGQVTYPDRERKRKHAQIESGLAHWVNDAESMSKLQDQETGEPLDLGKAGSRKQKEEMWWQYVVQLDPTYRSMSQDERDDFEYQFREGLNPDYDYENLLRPEEPGLVRRPGIQSAPRVPAASGPFPGTVPHGPPPRPRPRYIGPSSYPPPYEPPTPSGYPPPPQREAPFDQYTAQVLGVDHLRPPPQEPPPHPRQELRPLHALRPHHLFQPLEFIPALPDPLVVDFRRGSQLA